MRLVRLLTPLIVLSLVAVACGGDDDTTDADAASAAAVATAPGGSSDVPATVTQPAGGPMSAVDSTGATIELDGPAERIACLTEPCVDVLVELGLTPAAASPNGVTSLPEFFGEGAAEIPSIGGSFFEPAIEDVVAAEPDLVIGLEGVHEPIRDALGDIPLYIVGIDTTDEALEFLANAGTLTGHADLAADRAGAFTAKLDTAITGTDAELSVAVVYTGAYGFNINGTGSSVTAQMLSQIVDYPFVDEDAADHDGGYAQFSVEQLLAADPDWVFVNTIDDDGGQGEPSSVVMANDAVWGRLSAVAAGQVVDTRTPLWQYGRGTHSLGIILDEFLAAIA
ncbi:MAG TPA: ABC transporter substrate-binding protein [Ilumatobacter sp.]|nr:ABC transporter substrate-binding protein [Ilumatobacter sp.]